MWFLVSDIENIDRYARIYDKRLLCTVRIILEGFVYNINAL